MSERDHNLDDTDDDGELTRRVIDSQPRFANLIGIKIIYASVEGVQATLTVTEDLTNRAGSLHGGAMMSLGDNLGGTAAAIRCPDGFITMTAESKTNFFRKVKVGEIVTATCTCVGTKGQASVWETWLINEAGKKVAVVTQTQLTIRLPKTPN